MCEPQHVTTPALCMQSLCRCDVLRLRQRNHKCGPHGDNRDNRDLKEGLWSSKGRGRIGPRPPWEPKNLYLRPPGAPWGPRPCPGRSIHIFSWCLDPQILKIHDLPHQKPIFSYFSNIFGTRRRRRRRRQTHPGSHPPSSPSHTGKKHGVRPRILT